MRKDGVGPKSAVLSMYAEDGTVAVEYYHRQRKLHRAYYSNLEQALLFAQLYMGKCLYPGCEKGDGDGHDVPGRML